VSSSAMPVSPFRGYRFPPEIISYAVWLYRGSLSVTGRSRSCLPSGVSRLAMNPFV
jgi:hypothetical protein